MSSISFSTSNFFNTDDSRVMVFPKDKLDEIRQRLRGEDEGVVQHDFLTNIATSAAKKAYIEAVVARAHATDEDIDSDQEADRCDDDDSVSIDRCVRDETVAVARDGVNSCAAMGDDIGLGMQIVGRNVSDSMQSIFMMGDDTYIDHEGVGKTVAPMHNDRESCGVLEDSRNLNVCETGGQHTNVESFVINSPNEEENGVGSHVLNKVRDIASRTFGGGVVNEEIARRSAVDGNDAIGASDYDDTDRMMCNDSDSDDDSCQSWVTNAVNTSVELGGHVWNGVHIGFPKVDAGLDYAVDAVQSELSVPSYDACGTFKFNLSDFGHSRYTGMGLSSVTDLCVRENAKFKDYIERCHYPYLQTQAVLNNVNAFAVLQGIDERQCQYVLENSHSFE